MNPESVPIYIDRDKNGKPKKYRAEISCPGLDEYCEITATSINLIKHKIHCQYQKWHDKLKIKLEKEKIQKEKLEVKLRSEQELEHLENKTQEISELAASNLQVINNLLLHTLDIDDKVDFNTLKRFEPFPEPIPPEPIQPFYVSMLNKPDPSSHEFQPELSFWDNLLPFLKAKKVRLAEDAYSQALERYYKENDSRKKINEDNDAKYKLELSEYHDKLKAWEERKIDYESAKRDHNEKVDQLEADYKQCKREAVIEYCEIVLQRSQYPEYFPKEFDIEYDPDAKIIIVNYILPNLENIPKIKEAKFIKTKKEVKITNFSDKEIGDLFDDIAYKLSLRTIHELLEADVIDALNLVVFNGFSKGLNKATGRVDNNCIMSVQVKKSEFIKINLEKIVPKICFNSLKGISSTKLSSITPVAPILNIDKNDRRIVESYSVLSEMQDYTNLASIPWEDFEHLIREVFEKEFSQHGAEVKVTQASRDGGVDAIVFDPDPIRGGKIVIQAKRYTNTVGVSAVRDLFGTVQHEGAIKGILVTTANYGPDAFEFIRNKPLSLLNGSNLLYLLEKHGHKVKIDLEEAKRNAQ